MAVVCCGGGVRTLVLSADVHGFKPQRQDYVGVLADNNYDAFIRQENHSGLNYTLNRRSSYVCSGLHLRKQLLGVALFQALRKNKQRKYENSNKTI